MYKNSHLLSWLCLCLLLPSCSRTAPRITVVCEENDMGNCIVKWETAPRLEGPVRAYASTTPDGVPGEDPVATAQATDQVMTITNNDPTHRLYYTLVFADQYSVKTASRNVTIPHIQNFRDMGGYPVYSMGKQVRWGKLYRSAQMDQADDCTVRELKNIGIRTIIDLRTDVEQQADTRVRHHFNVVDIPLWTGHIGQVMHNIRQGNVSNDTLNKVMERFNREAMKRNTAQFRRVFDVLTDEANYPVVIQCSSGNGRTGLVAALTLAALGVSPESVVEDYRLSNQFFDVPRANRYAYELPAHSQEAITTLFAARESFIEAAQQEIEADYGTIDNYLHQAIGLSLDEQHALQQILLEK